MAKLERSIEATVVHWAAEQGIPTLKLKLDANSGWPDRIFLLDKGRAAFIEFKRKGKRPTDLQHHRLAILTSLGHHACWAERAQDAIYWLKRIQAS